MTTDKLANSPYLARFPWDWPPFAWDVALLLVDRWEGGAGDIPLLSDDARPELTDLKGVLERVPVEREQAPPLTETTSDGWAWPEAVAACLRGNMLWVRARSATSSYMQVPKELLTDRGKSLADIGYPVSEEERRGLLASAVDEYRAAAKLIPTRSLCLSVAAAEILLLDLQRGDEAMGAYIDWVSDATLSAWEAGCVCLNESTKLASVFLARAGLEPVDEDLLECGSGSISESENRTSWRWDEARGLTLQHHRGLAGEEYPIQDPRIPKGEGWRQVWLRVAESIMWDCMLDYVADLDLDNLNVHDVLGRGLLHDPTAAVLLDGFIRLENEGIATFLHGLFVDSPASASHETVLQAVESLREETRKQNELTRQRLWERSQEIREELLSLHDKVDRAADAIDGVARGLVLSMPEQRADAERFLQGHLVSLWPGLADETRSYIVNAHAFSVMNLKNADAWDWGLCTIELAKALEMVLRNSIPAALTDDSGIYDPIRRWRDAQPPSGRRGGGVDRMDIGDFSRFLRWAREDKMAAAFVEKRFKVHQDRQFVLSELPDLLARLNDFRNRAAHAGAQVKEKEAREMYQTVIGTGAAASLLVRLTNLA